MSRARINILHIDTLATIFSCEPVWQVFSITDKTEFTHKFHTNNERNAKSLKVAERFELVSRYATYTLYKKQQKFITLQGEVFQWGTTRVQDAQETTNWIISSKNQILTNNGTFVDYFERHTWKNTRRSRRKLWKAISVVTPSGYFIYLLVTYSTETKKKTLYVKNILIKLISESRSILTGSGKGSCKFLHDPRWGRRQIGEIAKKLKLIFFKSGR